MCWTLKIQQFNLRDFIDMEKNPFNCFKILIEMCYILNLTIQKCEFYDNDKS